jgi:carboxyl-terminal processing protease
VRPSLRLLVALCLGGCGVSEAPVGSIGAVLGRDPESRTVHVRDVPESALEPEEALLPGDELLMVEGLYVRELTTEELRKVLRGPPGSKVKLTVVRGEQILRLELRRKALRETPVRTKEERLSE